MKYINFKRFKFSIVTKSYNSLSYIFLTVLKYLNFKKFNKYLNFTRLYNHINFRRLYNYFNLKRLYNYFSLKKLYNYIYFKKNNFHKIIRKAIFKKYKNLHIYLVLFTTLLGFLYLTVPIFYNYDKATIEEIICKDKNITCQIKGKISYSFYPSPRIQIKNLEIYKSSSKKNKFIESEDTAIKLSIKNLIIKKKQVFKKLIFNNFKIYIDLKNLKKYQSIFEQNTDFIPIKFTKGEILFLDKNDHIVSIYDTKINLILNEDSQHTKIKGKFLDDDIYIKLNSEKVDKKPTTSITLKMSNLNLLTKVKYLNSSQDKNLVNGDIIIKKDKQKFTGIFNYKNNEITINKSNLRNKLFDGKLNGTIKFLPFFNFNLDLNLNSINFTKLYNSFLALDDKKQKNLFRINKKINGKLSITTDRIYSSYNLVKSFESRIKFNNGNISVEQFLINLGKLGAADILGTINNDKKFSNFKYESNVFIDNQKKFLSKFGVYNRDSIASNLFISGSFDLQNVRGTFYEILNKEKLPAEDINFIEQEFNDYMLEDGYKSLFRFPKFKEFIKSVTSKEN